MGNANSTALVWFAGYKNQIGFYLSTSGVKYFLEKYGHLKSSKVAIQLPIHWRRHQPLPLDTVAEIVRYVLERIWRKLKRRKNKAMSRRMFCSGGFYKALIK